MILRAGKHVNQTGYSLVVVMVAVVIMGILAEAAIVLDSYTVKKSKEAELLFVGLAYQKAIQSYVSAAVSQQPRYPQRLEDLLSDPRYAYRRHLRYLYSDPMIASRENGDFDVTKQWRILRNDKGGIVGIATKNMGKPLKKAFFPPTLNHFTKAKQYSDWIFEVN